MELDVGRISKGVAILLDFAVGKTHLEPKLHIPMHMDIEQYTSALSDGHMDSPIQTALVCKLNQNSVTPPHSHPKYNLTCALPFDTM